MNNVNRERTVSSEYRSLVGRSISYKFRDRKKSVFSPRYFLLLFIFYFFIFALLLSTLEKDIYYPKRGLLWLNMQSLSLRHCWVHSLRFFFHLSPSPAITRLLLRNVKVPTRFLFFWRDWSLTLVERQQATLRQCGQFVLPFCTPLSPQPKLLRGFM